MPTLILIPKDIFLFSFKDALIPLRNGEDTKTGARAVYPLHREWVDKFNLSKIWV